MPPASPVAQALPEPRLLRRLWLGVSLYLLVNATALAWMSGTADQDQAEQLLRSQSWALGYGAQPPLYTYLVKALLAITGPAVWPLLLLKAGLLSLLVAAVLCIGHELRLRTDQHLLALSGLALIPQFIWEAQRDLTHSVLATAVAALTLLQLLRLLRRPEPLQFVGLGALAALGMLSKYSFVVFLASLAIAAFSLPTLRQALLRPALALGVLAGLLVLAPHLSWMLQNSDQALSGLEKTQSMAGLSWKGILSALKAGVAFLSPFWLAALALLWPQRRQLHLADGRTEPGQALLQRLPLVLVGVMLVFVLATGATRIKDRWFQSLLFYAPLSVATLAAPIPERRLRWLVRAGLGAAGVAALLLPGRTALAGLSGKSSRPNHPLPQLVAAAAEGRPRPVLIVASNGLIGGNARLVFPEVPVITPRATLARPTTAGPVLVLLDPADDPAELTPLLQLPGITAAAGTHLQLAEISLPEHWNPGRRQAIRYGWLTLTTPAAASPSLAP
jgi:4-amino-4-deoxy-L-arabinose transferase-like glycosyltransferase